MTTSGAGDVAVRDAATVVVVRPGAGGAAEVLLVERHGASGFAAGAWVFPGGVVDPADATLAPERWAGIDPAALAGRFDAEPGLVLALHVAAVRETFEEAGLLLAHRADGTTAQIPATRFDRARHALADRRDPARFDRWLADEGLVADLGALELWGRWVTPRTEPKRYDTYFFLARAPVGQVAQHDRVETTGQRWLSPRAALERAAAGDLPLMFPTARTLEEMAGLASVEELARHAAARPAVRPVMPLVEPGPDGRPRIRHPDDPDFPARLDTGGGR